jgi:hypothetical protein
MQIDIKKVLENKNKRSDFLIRFDTLKENYSIPNELEFMDYVRSNLPSSILENSRYIYSLSTAGTDFLMSVVKSNDLTLDQLKSQKESIDSFIGKCAANNYKNANHLKQLKECSEFINSELTKKSSIEYLRDDLPYKMYIDFLPKPTLESTNKLVDEMDLIIQNINYKPAVVKNYDDLVKKIKLMDAGQVAINFVPILIKNTALILGLSILITGFTASLIVSLPLILVSAAIQKKIDKKYVKSYIAVIDKEIKKVNSAINDSPDYKLATLGEYLDNLKKAKSKLLDYYASRGVKMDKKIQKETRRAVKESLLSDTLELLNLKT